MGKKNRKLKRIILLIIVVLLMAIIFLGAYVLKYDKELMTYQNSLTNLPEVAQVLEISKYNGQEQYYVAKVKLTTDEEQYYFVKDDVVDISCPVTDLITSEAAANVALSAINQGNAIHYYLGVYDGNPVYEVVVTTENAEHYVIVDAKTGEITLQFVVK